MSPSSVRSVRDGSSALSSAVRGMGPSPTIAINELCDTLRRQGRRVFKLGLGQSPFPVPMPVVEALRAHATRKQYLCAKGLRALREMVAEYHRRRTGVPYGIDDIVVGPGSKELMFLLQVVYDEELLIATPAWVSYAPQARIVGRPVRFLRTDAAEGWRLDPGVLEAACEADPSRPRVLVLNYPSNPTGTTYSAGELEALADVARRWGVVILSDEIYGELHHEGQHVSIARFYPEGTIVSSGLSKWCGAGGWRLGTFAYPPDLRWMADAMAAVASETYTSTSTPIQYAAARAFAGGIEIERYLANARRVLAALAKEIVHRLVEAGVEVTPPVGAFYVFADFERHRERLAAKGIDTSVALTRRLLEDTGVAMLPGFVFDRDERELGARIAYVDFDGARALAAAELISPTLSIEVDFLERHCHNVLEAIDRLCAWLREA